MEGVSGDPARPPLEGPSLKWNLKIQFDSLRIRHSDHSSCRDDLCVIEDVGLTPYLDSSEELLGKDPATLMEVFSAAASLAGNGLQGGVRSLFAEELDHFKDPFSQAEWDDLKEQFEVIPVPRGEVDHMRKKGERGLLYGYIAVGILALMAIYRGSKPMYQWFRCKE